MGATIRNKRGEKSRGISCCHVNTGSGTKDNQQQDTGILDPQVSLFDTFGIFLLGEKGLFWMRGEARGLGLAVLKAQGPVLSACGSLWGMGGGEKLPGGAWALASFSLRWVDTSK